MTDTPSQTPRDSSDALRNKVRRRVQDSPARPVGDVLKVERDDVRRTTLYLPVAHVRELKKIAADEDSTMTALVQEGIAHVLRSRGRQ